MRRAVMTSNTPNLPQDHILLPQDISPITFLAQEISTLAFPREFSPHTLRQGVSSPTIFPQEHSAHILLQQQISPLTLLPPENVGQAILPADRLSSRSSRQNGGGIIPSGAPPA